MAANEDQGALSPDGRWLAYVSDETGRSEVYVRRVPSGDRVIRGVVGWTAELRARLQSVSAGAGPTP